MREIKFRTWDETGKRFDYWGFRKNAYMGFGSPNKTIKQDKQYTQQFTGLKDKNGKEAYHKDIAKIENVFNNDDYIGVIEWNDERARWYFQCQEPFSYYIPDLNSHPFEIIDNIHENKLGLIK